MKKLLHIILVFWLALSLASCSIFTRGKSAASAETTKVPASAVPTVVGLSPTTEKLPQDTAVSTPQAPAATQALPTQALVPAPKAEFPLPGIELKTAVREVEMAAKAGAYWIRRNALNWSQVEPQKGARNWQAVEALEKELIKGAENNLRVILVVRSTPPWAQKVAGSLCGPIKPEEQDAFAAFLVDAVARYSLPPYNVKYWEIGNEPDVDPSLVPSDSLFGCWGDKADVYYGGGEYAAVLKKVYPKIKTADSQARVLVGGLLLDCDPENPPAGKDCSPSRYLEGILREGGGDYFDGISFHAYDAYGGPYAYKNPNWHSNSETTGPVVVAKTRFLHRLLESYRVGGKFLMNTESGIICGRDGSEPACNDESFNLTKSYYLAEVNMAALAESLWANVWFSLLGWRGTALVDSKYQPYPAYNAFRYSAQVLSNAQFSRYVTEFPGVRGYEILRDGKRIWLLVSADGKEHAVQLPAAPAAIYDVFGASQPANQSLTITVAPLYIELSP